MHRLLKFFLRFLSPRTLERLSKIWIPVGKRVVIIGAGYKVASWLSFWLNEVGKSLSWTLPGLLEKDW